MAKHIDCTKIPDSVIESMAQALLAAMRREKSDAAANDERNVKPNDKEA